jgi:hypothetical protein
MGVNALAVAKIAAAARKSFAMMKVLFSMRMVPDAGAAEMWFGCGKRQVHHRHRHRHRNRVLCIDFGGSGG